MALTWKKITTPDINKFYTFYIQNRTILPNSKVYISVVKNPNPPDEANAFVIIGRQNLRLKVNAGEDVYYANEKGGYCVYSFAESVPVKNYDIPTVHANRLLSTPYTLLVKEGSQMAFQNLSLKDAYLSVEGSGQFTLTQYQMITFTFAKDTNVTMSGSTNNELVSYLISQSPSVTQLSEENEKLLQDIMDEMNLIIASMARKEEVEFVEKRTYLDKWSPVDTQTLSNTKSLVSGVFESMKDDFNSTDLTDGDIYSVLSVIDITHGSPQVTERANIVFDFIYKSTDVESIPLFIYTENMYLREHLTSVAIEANSGNNTIRYILNLDENIITADMNTQIRSEDKRWQINRSFFAADVSITFHQDLYNKDLFFITDEDYQLFMTDWTTHNNLYAERSATSIFSEYTETTDSDYSIKTINVANMNMKFQFYYPINDPTLEAKLEITIPKDDTIEDIYGINMVPATVAEGETPVDPISLNLSVLCYGGTVKTVSPDNLTQTFSKKIYKHSVFGYGHMDDNLHKYITATTIKKYDIELVY